MSAADDDEDAAVLESTMTTAAKPLPRHLMRHVRNLTRMFEQRGITFPYGRPRDQVRTSSLVVAECPRRGRVRVVFLNVDEAESEARAAQTGDMSIRVPATSVGKKRVLNELAAADPSGTHHLVLVVEHSVTPKGLEVLRTAATTTTTTTNATLRQTPMTFEVWSYSDLSKCIADHDLVPTYELVVTDDAQRRDVVRRFCAVGGGGIAASAATNACTATTCFHLPRIHEGSIMARYLDLKPGDLVRVTCDSTTVGRHVKYRVCISSNDCH